MDASRLQKLLTLLHLLAPPRRPQVMQATPHSISAVPYAALSEDDKAYVLLAWCGNVYEHYTRPARWLRWQVRQRRHHARRCVRWLLAEEEE